MLHRLRLDDREMGTGAKAELRELIGWDAAVVGNDELVDTRFVRCTHDTKCRAGVLV